MNEVLIEFCLPAEPLNMNKSDGAQGKRERLAAKAEWKKAAHFAACAAFPGVGPSGRAMPPSTVHVSIPVAGGRRRDPINYAPTTKVIVDVLQRAGFWPDDTPEYVTQEIPTLRIVESSELWKSKVYVRVVARQEESS